MVYYWRAFGAFLIFAVLCWWCYDYVNTKESEKDLMQQDPVAEAQKDFENGKVLFIEFFEQNYNYGEEGPLGYWIVPGEDEITEEILKKYPKRKRLETTFHFRISEEQEYQDARAREFARAYNLTMAKLAEKK